MEPQNQPQEDAAAPTYAVGGTGKIRTSQAPARIRPDGTNVPDQHFGEEIDGRDILVPEMSPQEVNENKASWSKPLVRVRVPDGIAPKTFRDVIANAFQGYVLGDDISVEKMSARTGIAARTIADVYATEQFKQAMSTRGAVLEGNATGLSAEQQFALEILTDISDKAGLGTKLKRAGITYSKYRAWMQNPAFAGVVKRSAENVMQANEEGMIQLAGMAANGDMAAIKFMWEVNNKHNPQRQQNADMHVFMSSIMEIIYRTVKDPDILGDIAREMKALGETSGIISHQPLEIEGGKDAGIYL